MRKQVGEYEIVIKGLGSASGSANCNVFKKGEKLPIFGTQFYPKKPKMKAAIIEWAENKIKTYNQ